MNSHILLLNFTLCSLIWEHSISQLDYVGWNTLIDNLGDAFRRAFKCLILSTICAVNVILI